MDIISKVLGKEIPLVAVDDASYSEILRGARVPEAYLSMLVMNQKGVREGRLQATH